MLSSGRTRLFGVLLLGALAACVAREDDVADQASEVSRGVFDKNKVIDDRELLDADAMTAAEVQSFLDKTPWGNRSVLAGYTENGRSAAQILHRAATTHGVNPLVLLVRLQMEHSLVRRESAPESTIREAFGCGCPHSPICSDRYRGFANQADCAAGTLRRSVDRAKSPPGTAGGWVTGVPKRTSDGITVTPANPGTAALYTYTPWVGQAGGGKQGVGGSSLHWQIWERFADEIGYGTSGADKPATPSGDTSGDEKSEKGSSGYDPPAGSSSSGGSSGADLPGGSSSSSGSSGADLPEGSSSGSSGSQGSSGYDPPASSSSSSGSSGADLPSWPDFGEFGEFGEWEVTVDGGAPPSDPAAPSTVPASPRTPEEQAAEDDAVLGPGNSTPSEFGPPPPSSGRKRPSLRAPEDDDTSSPAASSGCSATGATTSTSGASGLFALGALALALGGGRRRRTR